MQAKRLFVTLTVLFSLLLPSFAQAQKNRPIDFPDAALRVKIAEALGKRKNAPITTADMLALMKLDAPNANIRNLTGLEHAHNLTELNLGSEYIDGEGWNNSNAVSDVSPLTRLTNLKVLDLSDCSLSDILFVAKLTKLTSLSLWGNTISDVAPLANLTLLTSLDIWENTISDVSPLKNLTTLTRLQLGNNDISDISPLAELTKLTSLSLWGNTISDVAPLANLTLLTSLDVWGNTISDVSPLKNLTTLTQLQLGNNDISDISPLAELTKLTLLSLSDNTISDVSPLVKLNLTGTRWVSTGLHIQRNPLNYASVHTHIPAMQAKGIEIKFDERTPTTLLKISGTTQQGVVNTALPLPFVVEVLDEEDRAFAGVPVKFDVAAGRGKLNATTVKTDATGRALTRLTLGHTVGTTTVRVTATDISQPVQFTATAILHSSPVIIPDTNLRMKIMETLRKPLDETPTASDMLKLTALTANHADIFDLTGLQHAVNLTRLSLGNNHISNVSPLVGLTRLTTLDLRNNRISEVLPLIGVAQLNGAKEWNELYLQGNPLSDISISTHIPRLQAAGVNVHFDSGLTQPRHKVRLIYFLPRDRQPQPDIDAQMNIMIKEIQQFYADQMESHGFDRKTFQFETDARGNAIVYHINGKFDDIYYHDQSNIVWEEINEQFDTSKNIYLTALDISSESIGTGEGETACGTGSGGTHSGTVLIPASGHCFNFSTAAHELGHAFGLNHDFRNDSYIMSYGGARYKLSQCAAEWLAVHRAFNPSSQAASNGRATIEMLSASLVSPPNTIRLRFEVTDPDGLHQAQLQTPATDGDPGRLGSSKLLSGKSLNGKSSTVEFVTALLTPKNESVHLEVIDVNGNFTRSPNFPVDITSLLPSPKVVSIPDANLAAAIRQEIGDSITTHTMLNLIHLDAANSGIKNLTGLEHAHNLTELNLGGAYIDGEGNANSNAVSDVSPLTRLTNLKVLDLSECSLSDISFVAKLTQLTSLVLWGNTISDISPLVELTQLTQLSLQSNDISDISSLAELTQLTQLSLQSNDISDVSPLANLTKLNGLNLSGNTLSDVSPLAELTQLTWLSLSSNDISDISPLAELTKLTWLQLSGNTLSDVSPLAELTQLTWLHLSSNDISDISPLAELTQLTQLYLAYNIISDIAPLVKLNLTGTEWDNMGLYIERNPLNYASLHTHIPAMQAKGIEIKFNSRAPTTLVRISDTVLEGIVNTTLPLPFVVEVRDEQNRAFAGVPVMFAITAGGGRLSTTSTTTDLDGKAQAHLTLGRTPGTTTIRVAATDILQPVQFTATAISLSTLVAIPDAALHAEIASTLGKSMRSDLTVSDMLKLKTLTVDSANIHELIGLQHASNLTTLSLNDNNLSNIAPLAGLSKLTTLSLNNNLISDVAPLTALGQLQTLSLENNNLSDTTPLSGLTQLEMLSLDNNHLLDVSPFTGLLGLRTLSLNNNDLSDVSPLTSLRRLKTLQLKGNRLNYPSLHTHIPAIQTSGATVAIDPRTPTTLVKVSGTHGVAGTALPVIVEVQDEQGFGFSGVPVTLTVTAGGGRVSASNVITDRTGKARTTLTLGATPGKNTVRATAVEVRRPTLFTITGINTNSRVIIPDANLRAKVAETLGKPVGVQLTAGDMLSLTELEVPNANIRDLTGLEHAHNLEELDLSSEYIDGEGWSNSNAVSDFSPLTRLTNLKVLDLSDCSLSDLSFVAKLTQLTSLDLWGNTISDISPLAELTQLTQLSLQSNTISDVSPLANLTKLNGLNLWGNTISDVSPLANLTQLTWLHLYYKNTISDVSPLANLTQLRDLSLWGNTISDVSPLANLTQLRDLNLDDNDISDISPLAELTQLTQLRLHSNDISDISPLAELTQLTQLQLNSNNISDVSPLVKLNLTGTRWDSTGLHIERNPLNYASLHTHIPAMKAKGIEVEFDPRTPTTLVKISGDAQQGITNEALALPFVVEVRDGQNRVFAGVPVSFAITAGDGKVNAGITNTDVTGKAETYLTLGRTTGITTVHVAAKDISQLVKFTATAISLSTPVAIPDAALHAEIASALGKPRNATFTLSDMLKLTTLTADNANIRDLTGLQHASNLTTLSLNDNNLFDIAHLAGLSKLTTLSLNHNPLSDVAPLAALTQLETLSLDNNPLSDVSALSGLAHLKTLSLENNNLSDVAPLTSLTQLGTLQLRKNPLGYSSLHTHIPAIQAAGATVTVDLRTPTTLVKLSDTQGVAGKTLPIIVEVQDEQGLGFSGVPVTFSVTAGGGRVSASNVITDSTGRARTTLTLGATPGKNTVRATAVEVRRPTLFTITGINTNSRVVIRDDNLRTKIIQALSKSAGVQLTAGDMLTLTKLDAYNANIHDLIGLEHAHNLKELRLHHNAISDISALSELTQLTSLNLERNLISDISPLEGLTQLTQLELSRNAVSDVSALAGLTQLINLWLDSNTISDVSSLVGLNLAGTRLLPTGLTLDLNPLNYASRYRHIPAMQAKGIEVQFNTRTYPALDIISGAGQQAPPDETLAEPLVVAAIDAQGNPMKGVSVTFREIQGDGTLSTTTAITDAQGRAQTTLTLGSKVGINNIQARAATLKGYVSFFAIATMSAPVATRAEDVNADSIVNIQDLVMVASQLGQKGKKSADVNADGVVNVQDLVLVASALGTDAAAPAAWHRTTAGVPSRKVVEQWLVEARRLSTTDARSQRGILLLERLLAALAPKETVLLANYPNPFNPETWIPYQLAEPAVVTLRIYAVNGGLVRTLELGYQPAGRYQTRSRAAYWDGRNQQGERVASGIYFYTFSAGDFTATRKMLIRK